MQHPQHVTYVQPRSEFFGAQRSLLEVMRHLDRSKFIPHLIVICEGPLVEEAKAAGIDAEVMPWLANLTPKKPVLWIRAILRLHQWFRKKRIVLVTLSLKHGSLDGGVVYLAARLAGARFVFNNCLCLGWLSLYDKLWLSRADRIISITEAAIKPALSRRPSDLWSRIHPERIVVIPDGRDLRSLEAQASSSGFPLGAFGIPKEARIVGMVAAIHPWKRQDLFLQAAALVSQSVLRVWFVIVGSPYSRSPGEVQYLQRVQRIVEMLDLSDQVVFTGYRQDAVALMKHFDVLVLPSRTEALGGVLIEAMALGVPIVASSVGGIPEVVKDGETGLLIESSNPEDYAAAILRVLNDPPLAKRITVSAKAWGAQFDIQRIIGLLERCYEEVIGHYKQPALSEPCVRRER